MPTGTTIEAEYPKSAEVHQKAMRALNNYNIESNVHDKTILM